MSSERSPRTRYAPSPTGPLHLGHARTHLVVYALARSIGARIVMRIEDLDVPRTRPGMEDAILRDHEWLGLTFDEGPLRQSDRGEAYEAALARLAAAGAVYPCSCSRKEIESAASAPHGEDGPVYPGTCRNGPKNGARPLAWRFRMPEESTTFDDLFSGTETPTRGGDFVVKRADGLFAYQLAVVVDDAASRITHVVRGRDLVFSTPRQRALLHALGETPPAYGHVPLLLDADGRRLAKRDGAAPLAALRARGLRATQVLGALAASLGMLDTSCEASLDEIVASFVAGGSRIVERPFVFPDGAR